MSGLTAYDMARDLGDTMLAFLSNCDARATEEQRDALAKHMITAGLKWCNDEFDLGIKDGN